MPTIPKNQTDLARMLGIAKSAVSAQVRRGMPTTSLEAAQAWRREHIDPARKKGARLDRYYQPRQALPKKGEACEFAESANSLGVKAMSSASDRYYQPRQALPKKGEACEFAESANSLGVKAMSSASDRYYQPRQALPSPRADAQAQVISLMTTASDALARGQGIEAMVPALRDALAAVPPELRDDLGTLPMPVMRVLLRHVLDVLPARESNPTDEAGNPFYIDGTTLSDEDAKAAGAIWYEIAAGELVFDLDALREYYKRTAP